MGVHGPYLPVGRYGPCPERLREPFEGGVWRFRSSGQWREIPAEVGPWATVCGRFRVWRDAGVFTAPLEGLIAEGVRAGRTDPSLVSVDSATVRAHHDAAGLRISRHLMPALEEAAQECPDGWTVKAELSNGRIASTRGHKSICVKVPGSLGGRYGEKCLVVPGVAYRSATTGSWKSTSRRTSQGGCRASASA